MDKFKAGDMVRALKGFYTIKIGDILTVENSDEYWFQAAECRGYTLNVANYELYKPEFKNMKFRVYSPEHSKEIQQALFEMGYKWSDENNYLSVNANFIYAYEIGILKWNLHEADFAKNLNQEYTVETTKSYKLIPVESPKETITIDGKTYDKEAVLKRLAELESIQG